MLSWYLAVWCHLRMWYHHLLMMRHRVWTDYWIYQKLITCKVQTIITSPLMYTICKQLWHIPCAFSPQSLHVFDARKQLPTVAILHTAFVFNSSCPGLASDHIEPTAIFLCLTTLTCETPWFDNNDDDDDNSPHVQLLLQAISAAEGPPPLVHLRVALSFYVLRCYIYLTIWTRYCFD
jgi:hypothetical protein